MKVGIIQQHNTADAKDNMRRLAEKITKLAEGGATLIVLQELHNTLYFCKKETIGDFDLSEPIPGPSTDFFARLAKKNGVVIVTSLFEKRTPGLHHNTVVVMEKDGTIAGKYRKMHIPDDPGYYEKYYFSPGDTGFRPVDTSAGRLGIMVCWDQWFPEAARLMALRGAQLLIYPTAIGWSPNDNHDERQRQRTAWTTVQRGHAVANGLPVVTVNRVGKEDDCFFWGSSFVAGPQGELLYTAPDTGEAEAIIDIDMERSEKVRRAWPFLRDRRIDMYGDITKRYID